MEETKQPLISFFQREPRRRAEAFPNQPVWPTALVSDHVQLVPAPNIPLICVECQRDRNTLCFERLCSAGRFPGCFRLHRHIRLVGSKGTKRKKKKRIPPQLLPITHTHTHTTLEDISSSRTPAGLPASALHRSARRRRYEPEKRF